MIGFSLIPLPYKILGGLAIITALIVGSTWYGYNKAENKYIAKIATMEANAEVMQAKLDASLSEVKVDVLTKYVDRVKVIKEKEYVYRDKIVTVPSKCELSNGWVYLHDSVVKGSDADAVGVTDGASSGVKDTDALDVITENYGICKSNAAKLEALQDWIRKAKAEVDKANKEAEKKK